MKFIEISFLYIDSWVGDVNRECFYWKLRCQLVKLQDFWYNLLKYWRKLIINCTTHHTETQLVNITGQVVLPDPQN